MTTSANTTARELLEQAALWHATLGDEQATAEDIAACEAWCRQSSEHQQAFQHIASAWQQTDVGALSDRFQQPAADTVRKVIRKPPHLRNSLPVVAVVGLLGLLFLAQSWSLSGLMSDYYARKGERQQITLADGSNLILNSGSAVNIEFTPQQRRIILKQGELYIDVAHDTQRPLIIQTPYGTATALGTRYAVRETPGTMHVVVEQSKVRVCPSSQQSCVITAADQASDVRNGYASAPAVTDARIETAWRQGRLVADNWPLPRLLHELSRYYPGVLMFDADELMHLRVSGVFNTDDPQQALKQLALNLPVSVDGFRQVAARVSLRSSD